MIPLMISFLLSGGAQGLAPMDLTQGVSGAAVLDGQTQKAEFAKAARGTVLVFVSAKCPCSSSHEVALKELAREFEPQGFQFIGIHSNADEPKDLTTEHFKKSQLPFPVIEDPQQVLANHWGALKTPHVFLVGPDGRTLYQGGVDESRDHSRAQKHFLKDALAAVTQGKTPEQNQTRSLGCVIKR